MAVEARYIILWDIATCRKSQNTTAIASALVLSVYLSVCRQNANKNLAIANRSRTQFVEGVSVTLKSTSRVTQGHWKRNQWTNHTRLTIRRVIGRWILSWPWNVGQRSLKVIENDTIWKLGYGFLFDFFSNYGRIFGHFGDIPRQRMTWAWNLGLGSFKVIENGAVR